MKEYILTPETDPRCIDFYLKAFPELDRKEQEKMRQAWVGKMIVKNTN